MAVIRCPIHKIPYNEENPRGCPACHREAQGADPVEIRKQTARATGNTPVPVLPARTARGTPRPESARRTSAGEPAGRPFITVLVAAAGAAALAAVLLAVSGPRFVEAPQPPLLLGDARDLPVEPGAPVSVLFAVLGTREPRPHPTAPQLAQYAFGADLTVDAYNDAVYALTINVPNRTWRGQRVGMSERNARGALALLGTPGDVGTPPFRAPMVMSGYAVYASLAARPERTLGAQVRPPNGCYDVQLTLQPRAAGILIDGTQRYTVVGRAGAELEWVVTRVRVVSRALPGPYADGVAC